MNHETILSEFLNLEIECDLFDLRVNDVKVWERIRLRAFRRILYECGIINDAHDGIEYSPQTYLRALATLVQSGIRANPLLVDQHDFFFFGHPRRKIRDDGCWWDIYCDPIYDEINLDYIHMSTNDKLRNYSPRKTSNYRNLDFVRLSAYALRKSWSLSIDSNIPPTACRTFQKFNTKIKHRLDVEIDIEQMVIENLRRRASLKPFYDRILGRVDPSVAVVVVSYGNEPIIEACHDRGIPVVELQHGVINKYHLGYSYPKNRKKEVFPDYFFSWGEAWSSMVELPLSPEAVIPVGYPYLEHRVTNLQDTASEEMMVFISQGTIGEELSQLAVEFAERNPKLEVIYKLHPGEYNRWKTAYPWLTDAPLDVVDSNDPSLYELLAKATYQVGVYSTALYEGLFFGNETYIADFFGADRMEELLDQGDATIISTADELTAAIASNTGTGNDFDATDYFTPDATDRINTHLHQILSEQT